MEDVIDDPIVSNPEPTQTLCQNATTPALIILDVIASGGTGTFSYQWYENTVSSTTGTLIIGETNSTFTPPTATIGTMYYYCIVTQTGLGCETTSTISELIITPGPSFVDQPIGDTVCVGAIINPMSVSYTNGAGTANYQWYENGVAITGAIR